MWWWLYPCPQGVSLPLLHSPENYHICPHFTSLPTPSLSPFKCFGFLHLLLVSFHYPLIFTSCNRKKNIKPTYVIRCAWHITLHLNVQLSSPRPSFPKRSEVWAKSSQSRNTNSIKKVPLGPISSFSTDNLKGMLQAQLTTVVGILHTQLQFYLQPLGSKKLNEESKVKTHLAIELELF